MRFKKDTLLFLCQSLFLILLMIHLPYAFSQDSSPQDFNIAVIHEGGFAPIKLLDGVGLAIIHLDFSAQSDYWETNYGNKSTIKGQIYISGVPNGVVIKSYPDKKDFPINFTINLFPEDDLIGSWETEMWIHNINAAYGIHELTLQAIISDPQGLPVSTDSTTFHLSIQQPVPGFTPPTIIIGILVAATVILLIYRKNFPISNKR